MNEKNDIVFEPFQVRNPSWMKALLPIASLGFLGLGVFLFYLGIEAAYKDNWAGTVVLPLGAWIVYLSFLGYDLMKFGSHRILVSPKGIEVETNTSKSNYGWEQLVFKARDTYEILEIFDLSKRRLIAIDYKVPRAKALHQLLAHNTEPVASGQRR